MRLLKRLFGSRKSALKKKLEISKAGTSRQPIQKCGGCGNQSLAGLLLVQDKKHNHGYLCKLCEKEYGRLLRPDSIRNFWMCGVCGFRILAGTKVDAQVDEQGNQCPECTTDVNLSLVNLSNDRAIGRGVIGEPVD